MLGKIPNIALGKRAAWMLDTLNLASGCHDLKWVAVKGGAVLP